MADKSKTIKNATDAELNDILIRLRKEAEVQGILSDIKRRTMDGYTPYDYNQGISTEQPIENLYHFGVLGMHWGKKKASSITDPEGHYNATSEDHRKKISIMGKNVHEMSNAEIKAFNERMNLEKQYREFTKKQKSPFAKAASDVVANASKEVAKSFVSKYMTKGLEAAIKKAAKTT